MRQEYEPMLIGWGRSLNGLGGQHKAAVQIGNTNCASFIYFPNTNQIYLEKEKKCLWFINNMMMQSKIVMKFN